MLRRVLLSLVIFCFLLAVPAYAYEFVFVDSLETTARVVTLAQLVTAESEIPASWEQIIVSDAPGPGRSISLSASQVKRSLWEAGIDPEQLEITIPSRIQVYTPSQTLKPEEVEKEFQRQLKEVLELPVTDFAIQLVGWVQDLTLPLGEVQISVTEDETGLSESLLRSYASFDYQISVANQVVTDGRARVRVSGRIEVPVLTRDVKRHELLSSRDFSYQELELSQITPETFLDSEVLSGYRTTRLVRKGLPLEVSDVEIPPLVKYRSIVKLTVSYNNIYLETEGKALMDGRMGEIIKVENTSSGEIVSTKVIGANRVQALI